MTDFRTQRTRNSNHTSQSSWSYEDWITGRIAVPVLAGLAVEPLVFLTESLKTRLQVSSYIETQPIHKSSIEILKNVSLSKLYSGFGAGMLARAAYFLSKFQAVESTKFMFHAGVERVSFWREYSGLMLAELIGSATAAPFEVIKSRLICGLNKGIGDVIKSERTRLLERILMLNIFRMLTLRGIELITFTSTRDQLSKSLGEKPDSLQVTAASILIASLAGTLVIAPFDFLKTIKSLNDSKISATKLLYQTIKSEQRGKLYSGLIPMFGGIALHNTVFFGMRTYMNRKDSSISRKY